MNNWSSTVLITCNIRNITNHYLTLDTIQAYFQIAHELGGKLITSRATIFTRSNKQFAISLLRPLQIGTQIPVAINHL